MSPAAGRRGWPLVVALGALLAGCSGAASGGPGVPLAPEAPLPPTPPPKARVLAETPAGRTMALEGRRPLRLRLPSGYALQADHGDTFDIYHIWRVPPPPLPRDASLAILVGRPQLAYCPPGTGSERPAAFPRWAVRWHLCAERGSGRAIWETHLLVGARVPIHVFAIGTNGAEVRRLARIAETLQPLETAKP